MPITYTNHKGLTYTLYRGQTSTGKPRYYFGREDKGQGEPVMELPSGFKISESVNGVVSLVKDRPSPILPEEMAVIEAVIAGAWKFRSQFRSVGAEAMSWFRGWEVAGCS